MKRSIALLFALASVACTFADQSLPETDAQDAIEVGDARRMESLDLEALERVDVESPPPGMVMVVGGDGELEPISVEELAGDGEFLFLPPRAIVDPDVAIPEAATDASHHPSGTGLTTAPDPAAACACSYRRLWDVYAGTETGWVCIPAAPSPFGGGSGSICFPRQVAVYHEVECSNFCFACGVESCVNVTAGGSASQPSGSPAEEVWVACNQHNICSGGT